jgi:hypothetical protein
MHKETQPRTFDSALPNHQVAFIASSSLTRDSADVTTNGDAYLGGGDELPSNFQRMEI